MKKTEIAKMRGVLQKANPFLILERGTETPETYATDVDAYYDVLIRLFSAFPRGYMDLPLFLYDNMGMNINDAELMCGQRQIFELPLYDIDFPDRKDKLREALCVLLKLTGCKFNEQAFTTALTRFDVTSIHSNFKERIENGEIFKFLDNDGNEETSNNTSRY